MIKMNGLNNNMPVLNVPAWTLSAMLLSEFVIYALLYNSETLFRTLIVPCTIIVGLGVWRHIPKGNYEIWLGFTTFGMFRVFILYCLSLYCFELVKYLKAKLFTKKGVIALTVVEVICYIIPLLIIVRETSRNYRWIGTLLLLFAVAISVCEKSFSTRMVLDRKWTEWIGEYSMGIYLTHYPIMQLFRALYPGEAVLGQFIPFVISVLVAAAVFVKIVNALIRFCHRFNQWVSKTLIQ